MNRMFASLGIRSAVIFPKLAKMVCRTTIRLSAKTDFLILTKDLA